METSLMKDRLSDGGYAILEMIGSLLAVVIVICLIPFSLVTRSLRATVIAYKQRRALRRLTKKQRDLLWRLWEAEDNSRRYSEAYSRGYFDVGQAANAAIQRADDLIRECQQADIDDWRINAFRITSHDYWWWF